MKVKTLKVMFRDYFCFILVLACVLFLIVPWMLPFWLLLVPILLIRIRFIKRILKKGQTTTGVVTQKVRERRWGYIYRYAYSVGGVNYVTRNVVTRFKLTVNFNDQVQVVYNPQKPQQAFLPAFYLPSLGKK